MTHILGESGVVVYRTRTGRVTRYWAEGGIIKVEDAKPDGSVSYTEIVNLKDILLRILGINDMLGKSSNQGVEIDPQERKSLQDFVEQMIQLVRRAKDQGNPHYKLKDAGLAHISDVPVSQRHGNRVFIPQQFFVD